jgi:glycosyltransferase involved in cell wall biosynthesis
MTYAEASTTSFEDLRARSGPGAIRRRRRLEAGARERRDPHPQPARAPARGDGEACGRSGSPEQVAVINYGGASPREITDGIREAFDVVLEDSKHRLGRSAAANRGVALAREALVTFLDDDDRCYPDHVERLIGGHREGPEPVVYTDAATVVYGQGEGGWEPRVRTLQYSLDYDPDFLLLANYIPVHTVLLPRELYRKVGGFDERLEYSEDWDFLIRLSAETPFRHVRAVTCEYRVFEPQSGSGDSNPGHVASGAGAFQDARRKIFERYAARRTEAGLARMLDRMRAQIAFWYDRDGVSQGELRYQRESHRRLDAKVVRLETRENELTHEKARLASEIAQLHARLAESLARNEDYDRLLANANVEVERLNGILQQIYDSRTWKLHLFLDRLRGRR